MKEHYVEVGLPWFTTLSLPNNTDIVVVLRLLKLSVVVSNESAGRFARPSAAQFSSKRDDLSLAVSRLRAPLSTVTRSNAAAVCGGQWFLIDTTLKNRLRRRAQAHYIRYGYHLFFFHKYVTVNGQPNVQLHIRTFYAVAERSNVWSRLMFHTYPVFPPVQRKSQSRLCQRH